MSKKSVSLILFLVLAVNLVFVSIVLANDTVMNNMTEEHIVAEAMEMHGNMGPVIGGQMIHVYFDFLIFIIALFLVMKIGSGKIRYPIFILALGFLISALVPVVFGHGYMWLVALIKSSFGLLSVLLFIQVFGGMSLVFPKKDLNQ